MRGALIALGSLVACAPREPAIRVVMDTSEGHVHCRLDAAAAPRSVAMFLGFADGSAPHVDPSGQPDGRPLYRDLAFFRAIVGGYVQSGCNHGDGSGTPGYRVPVERSSGDASRLAMRGALYLVRYQAPPNRVDPEPPPPGQTIGSQFAIGLTDMSHLAGEVTVLGQCEDLDVVARIAARVVSGERVQLHSITRTQ